MISGGDLCCHYSLCLQTRPPCAPPTSLGGRLSIYFVHWSPAALGLCRCGVEDHKTNFCAWANEELFDTFPDFLEERRGFRVVCESLYRKLHLFRASASLSVQLSEKRRPDVRFSLFFFHVTVPRGWLCGATPATAINTTSDQNTPPPLPTLHNIPFPHITKHT